MDYALPDTYIAKLSQEALADKAAWEVFLNSTSPRLSLPKSLATRSRLEESLLQSWAASEPTPLRVQQIKDLLAAVTYKFERSEPVQRVTEGRMLRVDPFGSVAWGGSTGSKADLDLVVIVSHSAER